jgi:hypothetical protein
MTRHWAPLEGPQRAIMNLRARRDGRGRSAVDLELPLMVLLAVLVGIGVVIWLNGQGAPDSGEIRRVTERPQLQNPRAALAAGQAQRAAAARELAQARRVRAARRLARRRAALAAAAAPRPFERDQAQSQYDRYGNQYGGQSGNGYPASGPPDLSTSGETYTQQQQVQPAPAPKPAPKPQPKRTTGGGGGGGAQFDDSG